MVTGSVTVEWYPGILQNLKKESFVKTLRVKTASLMSVFATNEALIKVNYQISDRTGCSTTR
jgi:hypothetical protein